MRCVCGHDEADHTDRRSGTGCLYAWPCCTCVIYEPDDGTPTPSSAFHPDFKADPYNGRYASNGKYQP